MAPKRLLRIAICSSAWLMCGSGASLMAAFEADKPNIVFILADDQGWNGTSVQMHPEMQDSKSDYYSTPNLEQLAKSGLRFSAAYSPGPMCSPTRASIQTGKSPAQLGMTNVGGSRRATQSQRLILPRHTSTLSVNEVTIGETLQNAGYATAWFGKWHLGGDGPGAHGYDEHDGPTGNADGNTNDPDNPKDVFGITERGMAFMEKNVKAGKPFYLQLWHYAVHGPVQSSEKSRQAAADRPAGKTHSNPDFAGMTQDLDTGVGMILDKIEELKIADDTYVVYMSDHGAGRNLSSQAPLRSGKGTLWEGGLRVPLIIRGPGVAEGAFCQEQVVGWDLFPTFCDLAGVTQPLPKTLEGASLKPLFANPQGQLKRKRAELAFHFPHYGQTTPQSTILIGDYKLVKMYETDQYQLFDLKNDIGEAIDLSKKQPDRATAMHDQLNDYLSAIKAGVPSPNPQYDATATAESSRPGGRGGAGGRLRGARRTQLADRQKELVELETAIDQNDKKKLGRLLSEMKKRLENAPLPAGGAQRAGDARAASRERRQKSIAELGAAFQKNDVEKMKQVIAELKKRMQEQSVRPGGRRPGLRGSGEQASDRPGRQRAQSDK